MNSYKLSKYNKKKFKNIRQKGMNFYKGLKP